MSDDATRPDDAPAHPTEEHAPAQPSILGQLEVDGQAAPRVNLREIGTDGSDGPIGPPAKLSLRKGAARYEVIGEIARGGVGVVLRSRDRDVGRDVAMKVLREEHRERPEVIERFVEEAQIGGQLQHPGIVPIYELGLKDDDRPYFTMKLVKGETLAARLAARQADPSKHDVSRSHLRIFESVCQTVAYAHSRGVIHRDLKPANIMVGAFGEVQVVDWGLAKVLAAGGVADERRARRRAAEETIVETVRTESDGSDSMHGTVLGTPAYMPPEQALGQVDDLDERADVFALGAILCEILTGHPPYRADETAVVVKAVRSELDECYARLDACAADPELVALTLRCLSPTRSERPRNAGALASDVGSYLADVEARAHRSAVALVEAEAESARSEREAAEQRAQAQRARQSAKQAQARAEEAGRARRQARAIGFAMIAVLIVGIAAWMWIRRDQTAVRRNAAQRVEKALAEASYHEGREDWDAAVGAARKAVDLASSGGATEAVRLRAAETLDRLARHQGIVEATRARDERDRELVAQLEEIRALRLDRGSAREWDRQFARAFARHGIDVEGLTGEALGSKVATSVQRHELATFLDEWALLRRDTLARPSASWTPLLHAARIADPDSDRARIRRALAGDNRETLGEIEISLRGADPEAATWSLLGGALAATGERGAAVRALRRAQALLPGDVWLNIHLAQALTQVDPPDWEEAVRFYSVARALRPDSAPIRAALAHALSHTGQVKDAIQELRIAVRRQPKFAYAHNALGKLVLDAKGAKEALPYIRQALAEDPELAQAHASLAEVLRRMGQLIDAEAAANKAITLDTELVQGHENLFRVLAEKEDLDGALRAMETATRHFRAQVKRIGGGSGGVTPTSPGTEKSRPVIRRLREAWLGPKPRGKVDDGAQQVGTPAARQLSRGRVYAYVLEREGQYTDAIKAWSELLQAKPRDLLSQRRLARLLAFAPDPKLRDRKRAAELATTILTRVPGDPEARTMLALQRLAEGDMTESLRSLKDLAPNTRAGTAAHALVHLALALTHAKRLERTEAAAMLKTAIVAGGKLRDPLVGSFQLEVQMAVSALPPPDAEDEDE